MSLQDKLQWTAYKKYYYVSIGFFLLIVLFTAIMFFLNKKMDEQIMTLNTKLETIEYSIETHKSDEKMQMYELLKLNQPKLELLKYYSQIPTFIDHMKFIAEKYNIQLSGFSYSNGSVTSSVLTETDEGWVAYKKTTNFIKKYREDDKALFDLWFVSPLQGHSNQKFSINLDLKKK